MAITGVVLDPVDIKALRETLAVFSDRRFNATLAMGLTAVVGAVKDAEIHEMKDVFDRPTPWTLRAQYVKRATAEKLMAETGIAENPFAGRSPAYYLQYQIFGGPRGLKGFEKRLISGGAMRNDQRAVPGYHARLDNYGNFSRGQLNQIFSHLRIEQAAGATSVLPTIKKSGKGRLGTPLPRVGKGDNAETIKAKMKSINSSYRKAGGQYIAFPNGRGKMLPGIYLVRGPGGNVPLPVMIFMPYAMYEAERFDYYYVANRVVERELNPKLSEAIVKMTDYWYKKYGGK